MGIQGLLPFVERATRAAHLQEFSGKTAAIDGYCWLRARHAESAPPCIARVLPARGHPLPASIAPSSDCALADKAANRCPLEMVRGTYCTGFVDYCMELVALLRRNGVEPFIVLDGAALPAKAGTEDERRAKRQASVATANKLLANGPREAALKAFQSAVNITPEHAYQLILALRARGVRYVVAPYEADAQIALLATHGHVDLVIADDSDMIAFGCPYPCWGSNPGRAGDPSPVLLLTPLAHQSLVRAPPSEGAS